MPAANTKVKKTFLKKKKASDQKPPRMTPDEKRLVRDISSGLDMVMAMRRKDSESHKHLVP